MPVGIFLSPLERDRTLRPQPHPTYERRLYGWRIDKGVLNGLPCKSRVGGQPQLANPLDRTMPTAQELRMSTFVGATSTRFGSQQQADARQLEGHRHPLPFLPMVGKHDVRMARTDQ